MDFKLLGSILLVVGTCMGAGMLALPIATAELGFLNSLILLFICWFVMTAGALLLLEVNLWMPLNSNLNTMARATIGPLGQIISWLTFLLLLYSLVAAYIGGGSDLFYHLLLNSGYSLPRSLATIIFVLIFGSVVYMGIKSVDYVNRGLMFFKFSAYFLLIFFLMPIISPEKLASGNIHEITSEAAIAVSISSFGFATIVPSLRIYFKGDIAKLKKAIVIGSLIPLVCYSLWDAAIMGIVPIDGVNGLAAILHSQNSTSDLVKAMHAAVSSPYIALFVKVFTSVCVLTSFLGVSLCLVDFWADALQIEKKGKGNVLICLMAFLPPVIIVLFFPGIFVKALEYAGIYSIVLLAFLPAWMTWVGRYKRKFQSEFTVPGGKFLIIGLSVFSLLVLALFLSK